MDDIYAVFMSLSRYSNRYSTLMNAVFSEVDKHTHTYTHTDILLETILFTRIGRPDMNMYDTFDCIQWKMQVKVVYSDRTCPSKLLH